MPLFTSPSTISLFLLRRPSDTGFWSRNHPDNGSYKAGFFLAFSHADRAAEAHARNPAEAKGDTRKV